MLYQKFYIRRKTSICRKLVANKAAIFETNCEKLFSPPGIPSTARACRPIADGLQSAHNAKIGLRIALNFCQTVY